MLSLTRTLTASVAAGLIVAATGTAVASSPVAPAALRSVSSPAVELSAAIAPLLQPDLPAVSANVEAKAAGDWIINAYNVVQPWVQYGVNLAAWSVSWLPWPIGLIGPQANILYSGWQPIGQSLAYGAAFLLDRQFDLIIPTLVNGLKTGINNLVQGEIDWVLSFFPPLPPVPFPVPPGAATATRSAALPRSAATTPTPPVAEPAPESVATPRPPRPAGRAMSKTPRVAPAAASSSTVKAPKANRSAGKSKAKAGAASSTRTSRAAR